MLLNNLLLLFFICLELLPTEVGRVSIWKEKDINYQVVIASLMPFAWEIAKQDFVEYRPNKKVKVNRINLPNNIEIIRWYGKNFGVTFANDFIRISFTYDIDQDWDTLVHEFKHYIIQHVDVYNSPQFEIDSRWVEKANNSNKTLILSQ